MLRNAVLPLRQSALDEKQTTICCPQCSRCSAIRCTCAHASYWSIAAGISWHPRPQRFPQETECFYRCVLPIPPGPPQPAENRGAVLGQSLLLVEKKILKNLPQSTRISHNNIAPLPGLRRIPEACHWQPMPMVRESTFNSSWRDASPGLCTCQLGSSVHTSTAIIVVPEAVSPAAS